MINNKYLLLDKIGEGSFGSIYKGQNIRTKEFIAIKIEPIIHGIKLLKNESIIYQYLSGITGIPCVKWFGKDDTNYYMIINLLGNSLQSLKNKIGYFSLSLTLKFGIKILLLLKSIHEKGIIHRDIKPDNFLFKDNDQKQLYIIDFGFCKTYLQNDIHIQPKKNKSIIGSFNYASINSHNLDELSRRDDLESLGYMLIYFYKGYLDWQNIELINCDEKNQIFKKLKQDVILNKQIPSVLINYISHVRNLKFDETPNYNYYTDNFIHEIKLLHENKLNTTANIL
jgi:serine/threonine protein kinase